MGEEDVTLAKHTLNLDGGRWNEEVVTSHARDVRKPEAMVVPPLQCVSS
jgi:hypothetical protein